MVIQCLFRLFFLDSDYCVHFLDFEYIFPDMFYVFRVVYVNVELSDEYAGIAFYVDAADVDVIAVGYDLENVNEDAFTVDAPYFDGFFKGKHFVGVPSH